MKYLHSGNLLKVRRCRDVMKNLQSGNLLKVRRCRGGDECDYYYYYYYYYYNLNNRQGTVMCLDAIQ